MKQSPNNFPDDNFHEMVLSPSILFDSEYFDIKGEAQLFDIEAPVIVAMQGWSIGASFQRALLCDIRVAADDARFMLPESAFKVFTNFSFFFFFLKIV